MLKIYGAARGINPAGVESYFDKLHVWLRRPLTGDEVEELRQECRRGLHVGTEPASFDPGYRQLLQLHHPTRRALEMLVARNDTHLNYLEVALDLTFADQDDTDDAFRLIDRYHVKRHHRRQRLTYVGEGSVTRYSGPRSAPNVVVTYADRPSKATGELHSAHLEWRIRGSAALRRAGIRSVADLLLLKPRTFWLNRLLLYGLDQGELGRLYHNRYSRKRGAKKRARRSPWIIRHRRSKFTYDMNQRAGQTIERALGSTQAVLDFYGPVLGSMLRERCLVAMDDAHLLPGWGTSFD